VRNRKKALQARVDVREPSVVELTVRAHPEPPPTFPISRGTEPVGSLPTLTVS
jgi:hypothetical protein